MLIDDVAVLLVAGRRHRIDDHLLALLVHQVVQEVVALDGIEYEIAGAAGGTRLAREPTHFLYSRFVLGNKFDFNILLYGQIGSHKDEATLDTLQLRCPHILQLGQFVLIDVVDLGSLGLAAEEDKTKWRII